MDDEEPIDYPEVRKRSPWVGLGPAEEGDFSARYREIMNNRP